VKFSPSRSFLNSIFSYQLLESIISIQRVCKKWRDLISWLLPSLQVELFFHSAPSTSSFFPKTNIQPRPGPMV
jgi:hypothetical protein